MHLITRLEDLKSVHNVREVGITIGNFDGVHIGHKALLTDVKMECDKQGWPLSVMTFVPHPIFILKSQEEYLLNTYEERRELLSEAGVDFLCEVNFTRDFSTLGPEKFLDTYVLASGCVKKIFLGYDFAFGANKAGSHDLVINYCKDKMVECSVQKEFFTSTKNSQSVSSSLVRKHLKKGDVDQANTFLGRPFFIQGGVIKGVGRGRQIGFPTANIHFSHLRLVPQRGVYITTARVRGIDHFAVTNIGFNPTFNDEQNLHVETHILDFDEDIYGEEIIVSFHIKLRDELKFSGVKELVSQISNDVELVREYFKNEG